MHRPLLMVILFMIIGELLTIVGQLLAAKFRSDSFLLDYLPYLLITIGGIVLVFTYRSGYESVGSIWIVAVISLVSILVLEPLIIFVMFNELPSKGALLGFIFGAAGMISVICYE